MVSGPFCSLSFWKTWYSAMAEDSDVKNDEGDMHS